LALLAAVRLRLVLCGTSRHAKHGRWLIAPEGTITKTNRHYRPASLVLETEFTTPQGEVVLVDFMPLRETGSSVTRFVVGKRGRVTMSVGLIIRFGYGVHVPWVRRLDNGALTAIVGPDMLTLTTSVELHGEGPKTVGTSSFLRSQPQRVA
jgi:GH15 family glucan-1,4-alpha-glucosidase